MALAISRGNDGVVTAWLDDELDAATAPRLAQLLSLVALPGSRVVLDMSRVTFMDCAGLGEIMRAHHRAVEGGGWLKLAYVPDGPLLVLQLTNTAQLLTAYGLPEQRVDGD